MESIGNILYSVITEIGKEKIQSDITLNIDEYRAIKTIYPGDIG